VEPTVAAKYAAPESDKSAFTCVHCGVYASQSWHDVLLSAAHRGGDRFGYPHAKFARCLSCGGFSIWHGTSQVHPPASAAPPPEPDLPDELVRDYEEARDILARSPRGAAALLRFVLQRLMAHLGEKGKDINADIGALVQKGLPVQVQQALDAVRVIGNNAVHPGELDLRDDHATAGQLFEVINFIVQDRISRPRDLQELYDRLPQGAKDAIAKRDGQVQAAGQGSS
jgi:hypothetical protein